MKFFAQTDVNALTHTSCRITLVLSFEKIKILDFSDNNRSIIF